MPSEPIKIGKYIVDLPSLRGIEHRCDSTLCKDRGSCCEHFEVHVSEAEAAYMTGCMAHAARYAPHLVEDGELIHPFDDPDDPADRGGYILDTDERGLCVFAFRGQGGGVLCSLHAAALDMGIPPIQAKPRACALWPVALTEGKPLTVSICNDAFKFPCNRRRAKSARGIDAGIVEILDDYFGKAFRVAVEKACAPGG